MKISSEDIKFFKKKIFYAAEKVLEIYYQPFEVYYKEDKSPLTDADIIANQILLEAIRTRFPTDFILSEEIKLTKNQPLPDKFWIIDPIDGTKEFVNKTGDFTLNIGYIENGFPVWGMVYAPVYQELYYGGTNFGIFYEKKGISQTIKKMNYQEVIALISRNHFTGKEDKILKHLGTTQKIPLGSSLKICKLAINQADIYLRLGETSEWDIAPADAILTASGGTIITINNERLKYGKPTLNNPSFIALSYQYIKKFPHYLELLSKVFQ